MKKVLAIGASNSKKSINKIFANYIANQLTNVQVTQVDWDDIVLPLYSPDLEVEKGIPPQAQEFKDLIDSSDVIVLSLAEYNGMCTPAFKNLWDWTSRIDMKFWANKPMFLAATSPGKRGAQNALKVTKELFPHFGGNTIVDFSLPSFFENFSEDGITNEDLQKTLTDKIALFQKEIQ